MQSRRQILERATPLSLALPGAQFAEWHAAVLTGPPEQVWEVFHALRWSQLRISVPLVRLRATGARLDLDRRLVEAPSPGAPVFEEAPHVSASGMIGQPWRPRPRSGSAVTSLDQLRDFDEPGWLKYGMEWVFSPLPGGRTFAETSTLCQATDLAARLQFTAYWAVIRAFSGLIRRDMLAALQRGLR